MFGFLGAWGKRGKYSDELVVRDAAEGVIVGIISDGAIDRKYFIFVILCNNIDCFGVGEVVILYDIGKFEIISDIAREFSHTGDITLSSGTLVASFERKRDLVEKLAQTMDE